jgi:hypothetical protein
MDFLFFQKPFPKSDEALQEVSARLNDTLPSYSSMNVDRTQKIGFFSMGEKIFQKLVEKSENFSKKEMENGN